jgi:HEAT repeat protein
MDQSSTFARHFSRLVWLLMNESGSVDEQKMALRALVQVSKVGSVALSVAKGELSAGGAVVPGVLTGVRELVAQMSAHSVAAVAVGEGSGPAELLGFAKIVAAEAAKNDGGAALKQRLALLGAPSIAFEAMPASQTPETEAITAPKELTNTPTATSPTPAVATPAVPEAPASAPAAPRPSLEARKISEASAELLAQLSGRQVTTLSPEELFDGLDKAVKASFLQPASKVLDDMVALAEHSARIGKPKVTLDLIHGLVVRYPKLTNPEIKAVTTVAVKRLSKPALLRAVAGLLNKHPDKKQAAYEVLRAAAEEGAEAVIEQVSQAKSADERASLVEVLRELTDAVPALIRMLGDSRWFVVRNAADLLGEMAASKAEEPLNDLLRHSDDRVRRAATNALLKLGTSTSVKGVYEAVNDSSPEVRMQAASALSSRKDSKTSATLIRAIEGEDDGDVQTAMIAALGKIATPDAVQKLTKLAEAETRMFRKKDSAMRIAAVLALGEARSPAAVNALKALIDDKDREVRETASRALAQIGVR